jgi:hypothetical protein
MENKMSLLGYSLMAAPSAIKLLGGLTGLGKSKPSPEEKKLFRMNELFGDESSVPLTETTAFKSGKSMIEQRDRDNRTAINDNSAASGRTNEAKLSSMNASNRNYNNSLQRLLRLSQNEQNRNRGMYLNTLSGLHSMRNRRKAQNRARWGSILDPIGQAGQALTMAEMMFGDSGGSGKLKTDRDYNNPNAGVWGGA